MRAPADPAPPAGAYLARLFSLSGRTALVTGGSSGIGYAMAEAIGRAGAAVVVVARRPPELAEAVAALRAQGVRAGSIAADLAEAEAVRDVCARAASFFGEIDILANVAANNIRRPMAELTPDDHDLTMRVNVTAPFLLGQHFGPRMAARGWGRIINVGSQQSISAFGDSGVYGVSKAAIAGLTRSQAEAWSRHGVSVNTVIPGFVLTPLTAPAQAVPGRVEAMAARSMIGRNGLPSDFAGAAVLLAGDGAAYITGQTLYVDGGFSVH
ncbi:SDR family NAD(P)-dependent oxidoreductase [Sphaerisporangium album]|uniref:SDR family NAD(P)-dependent oxidoreductase n=1 Tax=Sphaerisporangium album TaxID=509200 RepID=A0A367EPV4_9ACTN|nr:SDR family oxidoreductase [Sphaerisporangium album]RCG20114.1 SDR family NAD(P)-dependent oxidoreductase [Sphaerisporangium album]